MPGSPSCGRAHDPSAAKKKLAEAGYGGEPIVVIAPTELAGIRALSLIGAGQLRHAKTPNARDALGEARPRSNTVDKQQHRGPGERDHRCGGGSGQKTDGPVVRAI
jgi:hypothetical protein